LAWGELSSALSGITLGKLILSNRKEKFIKLLQSNRKMIKDYIKNIIDEEKLRNNEDIKKETKESNINFINIKKFY
jgi:hypothetical protein